MMNKYIRMTAAGLATMLMLTGCGNQIPVLTEEQAQMIGEYAAITLLKYDANHRSRLVDEEEIEAHDAKEQAMQELAQATPTPTPEGMKPVEETPTVEIEENNTASEVIGFEDFYGLPAGITITYQGEEVCDSYSGDTSSDIFALDATQGKKLLVLKFVIDNQSGSDQSIDLFSTTASYRVTVNGSYTRNALTTMLMDDMSTYMDTIPAGESRNVVLLIEIDENMADTITSVSLNFKDEQKTGTIQLK